MTASYLRADLASEVVAAQLLNWAVKVAENADDDDVYRNKEGRKTLRFECRGKSYFLKLHTGIGWGEIAKNLLQLRLPVLGASNEYCAVTRLQAIGVDTMSIAAYASQGSNPAKIQSLIVTDDLVGTIPLEEYCAHWKQEPPEIGIRHRIIKKLADSARRMHGAGINHRDFYLCHFHLDIETLNAPEISCFLIDLHRAQIRKNTPRRWLVKDLAGLYFSAMDCGLTRRDLLRFLFHYCPGGLRQALGPQASFWRDVTRSAVKLYRKDHGRAPPQISGLLDD